MRVEGMVLDDGSIAKLTGIDEYWRCTMELRYLRNVSSFGSAYTNLQQKWVNQDGEIQWRTVETVYE